jgi:hypothetical protein
LNERERVRAYGTHPTQATLADKSSKIFEYHNKNQKDLNLSKRERIHRLWVFDLDKLCY